MLTKLYNLTRNNLSKIVMILFIALGLILGMSLFDNTTSIDLTEFLFIKSMTLIGIYICYLAAVFFAPQDEFIIEDEN